MFTISTVPNQLKLIGAMLVVAALVITLLAAGMTASPTMAQDEDKGPRTGENTDEYVKPYPCSEEAEPDSGTTDIVHKGFYPVFEGFWDYEVGHLSNNFCPPVVTKTTVRSPGRPPVENYDRKDAKVHISKTVFSVPDSYKVTVVDSDETNGNPSSVTGPKIDLAKYPFLDDVVSAVKTENGESVFANNSLYWVKPDGMSPLDVGFSTALMKEWNWHNPDGGAPVVFRFAAVHVLQDGTPKEAHVLGAHFFAFDPGAMHDKPKWSNVKTDPYSEVKMQTGKYQSMQFVFTKPGQYLVQAQVQGYVRDAKNRLATAPSGWSPLSDDVSITSPVQWYTFHVGSEVDLDVALTAGEISTTGNTRTVPVTVTANNSGPNGAENVEVEINLPAGTSAPSTLPAGATSTECGVVAWEIGDMASGASLTLSFNAVVDSKASGHRTATAEIRSTTFETDATDNDASVDMRLGAGSVRPPYFPGATRTIVEHAIAGTHAGDPVAAVSPENWPLSYSLSGPCSNKFHVYSNGQIVLADGHTLDYETQWKYPLTLHVSDNMNASEGVDTSIDDSTPVLIQVQDSSPDDIHPTVSFTISNSASDDQQNLDPNSVKVGDNIIVKAKLVGGPEGATLSYLWENPPGISGLSWKKNDYPAQKDSPGKETYTVHIMWQGDGITASYTVTWHPRS